MAFYGSILTNETSWDRTFKGHARHIACPQRLKYIHDVKDGYIPYVEDFGYFDRSSCRNALPKTNGLGLYNTADIWRQELMGLAQQVQSSFSPLHESRSIRRLSKQSRSPVTPHLGENDEQYISKRLLNRRSSARYPHSYSLKPRIAINENDQESSTNSKTQDAGIWLLPILCYILQVDNITNAQEWLVNANPTEKRLAMELISRTMQDIQNHENDFLPDLPICEQTSTASNYNNLYWPYKFWQHQQQAKLPMDNNDTCERATSPVRFLTPANRISVSSISSRSNRSRSDTRLSTPMITNSDNNARSSRRGYRVATSRNTSDLKSLSANPRGRTPLI